MSVWYDVLGDGPPVVLIHAGIADSRMWEPQLKSFPKSHTVVRVDLPGYGNSPYKRDVVSYRGVVRETLDATGIEQAALVGVSFGGAVALALALDSPERVSALVLVGASLDDHDWSEEVKSYDEQETEAFERGDLDAAANVSLQVWLAGPRRNLEDVDLHLRELVAEMQRNAYRLAKGHDDVRADRLDPPASKRLHEIRVPTLILTGDEDVDDIHEMADRLAREIRGAKRAHMSGAAHLPNLERPDEFDSIVLGFLREHGV